MLLLLLSLCVAATGRVTRDASDFETAALKVLEEMRPTYRDLGYSDEQIDERTDTFIDNYKSFHELSGQPGNTFTTNLNAIELLNDDEIQAELAEWMLGDHEVTAEEATLPPPPPRTRQGLESQYGEELYEEARHVFLTLTPYWKNYGIDIDNMEFHFESFIEGYKKYKDSVSGSTESGKEKLEDLINAAVDSIEVISSLGDPVDPVMQQRKQGELEEEEPTEEEEPIKPLDHVGHQHLQYRRSWDLGFFGDSLPIDNYIATTPESKNPERVAACEKNQRKTMGQIQMLWYLRHFNLFDANDDGSISIDEFGNVYEKILNNPYLNNTVLNNTFIGEWDVDKSSTLGFNEFFALMASNTWKNIQHTNQTTTLESTKNHLTSYSKQPTCRRCKFINGVPEEFNDWVDNGYVGSLFHPRAATTMPAGWAHTAQQMMDMYQQIFSKEYILYREDLTSFWHILNCVYDAHQSGLARGSPQAALQYFSEKVVVPKYKTGVMPKNCRNRADADCVAEEEEEVYHDLNLSLRERQDVKVFLKFVYIWFQSTKRLLDEPNYCSEPLQFDPSNSATKNVTFLPGKAYFRFTDDQTDVVEIEKTDTTVHGERIAKPMLYKKGPLAVMIQCCWEIFFIGNGVFNYDCSRSQRRYLDQWVVLVSYGPNWFGAVLPKVGISGGTYDWLIINRNKNKNRHPLATVTKISRVEHFTFRWDSFVLPRVAPYKNTEECINGGISTGTGRCYCPLGKYGPRCEKDCEVNCQNGGTMSRMGCKCDCPNSHYGRECRKPCPCGPHGKCDKQGNCVCNRQTSWGPNCENECSTCNGGYCHNDGTCECLAGFKGPTCSDECDYKCVSPKVCRYSAQMTTAGKVLDSFCDCMFGFYGPDCDTKVPCSEPDLEKPSYCQNVQYRNQCFTDEAKEKCPHMCGHCLWLNQMTNNDS